MSTVRYMKVRSNDVIVGILFILDNRVFAALRALDVLPVLIVARAARSMTLVRRRSHAIDERAEKVPVLCFVYTVQLVSG